MSICGKWKCQTETEIKCLVGRERVIETENERERDRSSIRICRRRVEQRWSPSTFSPSITRFHLNLFILYLPRSSIAPSISLLHFYCVLFQKILVAYFLPYWSLTEHFSRVTRTTWHDSRYPNTSTPSKRIFYYFFSSLFYLRNFPSICDD